MSRLRIVYINMRIILIWHSAIVTHSTGDLIFAKRFNRDAMHFL